MIIISGSSVSDNLFFNKPTCKHIEQFNLAPLQSNRQYQVVVKVKPPPHFVVRLWDAAAERHRPHIVAAVDMERPPGDRFALVPGWGHGLTWENVVVRGVAETVMAKTTGQLREIMDVVVAVVVMECVHSHSLAWLLKPAMQKGGTF